MADLWKISVFVAILAGTVFISAARLFSFAGITPNLVLLIFCLAFFGTDFGRHLKWPAVLFVTAVFLILSATVIWFWLPSAVILSATLLGIYFFARNLTGEAFLDLLLALLAGTIVFYGLSALILIRPFLPFTVLLDLLYTALLGVVLWWPMGWISKN
jgi:hypothetical protein